MAKSGAAHSTFWSMANTSLLLRECRSESTAKSFIHYSLSQLFLNRAGISVSIQQGRYSLAVSVQQQRNGNGLV